MKKKIILTSILALTLIILPNKVHAVTLKQYEDDVAKYQAEIDEKKAQLAKNNETLAGIVKKIKDLQTQIDNNKKEQENLQNEINESNKEIAKKIDESKAIMAYYQIENGDNAYLEYAFGAETITDMIYRLSITEQLTDYNDKIMKELKELIQKNEARKKELESKKQELNEMVEAQKTEQKKIEEDSKSVSGTIPNVENNLKVAQQKVSYYKSKGCKSEDIIGVTCDVPPKVKPRNSSASNVILANGFTNPVSGIRGIRITNEYGQRQKFPPYSHKGLDFSNRNCGGDIHAVASGRVYYAGNGLDLYGANIVLIVHNVNGRLVFSQYAHVQGITVKPEQNVDAGQVIAHIGNTGLSTACHLHLEMSEDYGWNYNSTYSTYTKHLVNPHKYIG